MSDRARTELERMTGAELMIYVKDQSDAAIAGVINRLTSALWELERAAAATYQAWHEDLPPDAPNLHLAITEMFGPAEEAHWILNHPEELAMQALSTVEEPPTDTPLPSDSASVLDQTQPPHDCIAAESEIVRLEALVPQPSGLREALESVIAAIEDHESPDGICRWNRWEHDAVRIARAALEAPVSA